MAGIITHFLAALFSLTVVHILHFKWEYSLSIFIGNFIPDAIKFLFSAIKQGSLQIFNIKKDSFYHWINTFTSDPSNWMSLGFFIMTITLFLYHYHYIQKKKMFEYDELYIFFIIGIFTHLIIDFFFIESSIWI